MLSPSPFTVLTHGDICPDNVFDHEGKDLQLIDFEWNFVRNALLDGTYLRMSMPTCWCANDCSRELLTNNADWIDHFYKNAPGHPQAPIYLRPPPRINAKSKPRPEDEELRGNQDLIFVLY
jgi:hypothetical protein